MVYIHVPFCRSFCTYCDFYSEICRRGDMDAIENYTLGLCHEIRTRKSEVEATLGIDTLYVGGGTPSVLPPDFYARVLDALGPCMEKRHVGFREFTVEVNPEDIVEKGEEYARSLIGLGVNRFSMGVQSLDDRLLRWMNRRHSASGAEEAFRMLRAAGAGNISVDVIFGISFLRDETLKATLAEILSWRPEHISAYQLSIEEGSALSEMVEDGRYGEASDDRCLGQYRIICDALSAAGYEHYEISNWALPGYRAVHNSAYWTRRPYVGLGPGAHSFDGCRRNWNSCRPSGWQCESGETLTPAEALEEEIMLGLRTADGIRADICDAHKVEELVAEGSLAILPGGRVRIPEDRFFVSDDIIARIFP